MKTNAMRILDKLSIPYEIFQYEIDDEIKEDIALYTSKKLGLAPELIYKTIVMVSSSNDYFVFCLPAGFEISMKKAREVTGCNAIDLLKTDKLLNLTGYIRGGVSPLGMKRHFPTFIEEISQLEPFIYVSGGQRGLSLKIKPSDLLTACDAQFASFT
ncbi:MAG: aminoacyl-tRNA deacylase [Sphaerochaetaceae bacterium]|nr:aminoacyl-tRNA deacylase [Sphaerochaetaceae bacterium]